MKLLSDYFKIQKEIYEYFGYEENYRVIPLDDHTDYYWNITGEGYGGQVLFAIDINNVFDGTDDDGYSSEIYTQRFLKKWVYRAEDYTMICIDTHVDGNKFIAVFDNAKYVTEDSDIEQKGQEV